MRGSVDTSQYTMPQRCCMHRLAIPVIGILSMIIASLITAPLLFLLVHDG